MNDSELPPGTFVGFDHPVHGVPKEEFEPFPKFDKIPRYYRTITITEKIDGSNGLIRVSEEPLVDGICIDTVGLDLWVKAGSRSRWITPEKDNFGFARWVHDNAKDLVFLGPGDHYGEWWGGKIQRGYGLKGQGAKRFSLFNVGRWHQHDQEPREVGTQFKDKTTEPAPACCHVVPVLYRGPHNQTKIQDALQNLQVNGSVAAPGFDNPEGIVVFLESARKFTKVTLENDGLPKEMVK